MTEHGKKTFSSCLLGGFFYLQPWRKETQDLNVHVKQYVVQAYCLMSLQDEGTTIKCLAQGHKCQDQEPNQPFNNTRGLTSQHRLPHYSAHTYSAVQVILCGIKNESSAVNRAMNFCQIRCSRLLCPDSPNPQSRLYFFGHTEIKLYRIPHP